MKTYDIGPLFVAPTRFVTNMARMPLLGILPSQETEEPYRYSKTLFLRIPLTPFGGLLGWWRKPVQDESSALLGAIYGTGWDLNSEIEDEDKRHVRQLVADHVLDVDDEWEILNILGLDVD